MRSLVDMRMRVTGQNGVSDYDLGFTNFLSTFETSAIARADAAARRRLGRDASDEGRERITCFAGQRRLPTITGSNTLAKPGILMVYGPKHTPFLNGHRRKLAAVVPPRSVKSITRAAVSGAELRGAIATPR
jgi:hypothetical protein